MSAIGCYMHDYEDYYDYLGFWTAGQQIDLKLHSSQYIWRVTSTDGYSETLSTMTYTNWENEGSYDSIYLLGDHSYKWDDAHSWDEKCSVCELDVLYDQ